MIDREALVRRHNPHLQRPEPRWPLQIGNGTFAFAADVTGLQTFAADYPHSYSGDTGTLLGTMSSWGWHTQPPPRPYTLAETVRLYDTPRGPRPYVDMTRTDLDSQVIGNQAQEWLRNNPHRLNLARIGFVTDATLADLVAAGDLSSDLDLWTGVLTSAFHRPDGGAVDVTTAVHPDRDAVAIRSTTRWPIRLSFSYGSQSWALADDWTKPDAHTTTLTQVQGRWRIDRVLDDTHYSVWLDTDGTPELTGTHEVTVDGVGDLVATFVEGKATTAPGTASPLDAEAVFCASSAYWPTFWRSGGAVDLGAVTDPRAAELERRIVLSQWVTRIGGTAQMPPAETGLLTNSWRGKAHLEMHWWHAAHLPLWGRPNLLEPALDWYLSIGESARATATAQGYEGVRWPKQVGPEGRESPSDIGTFLLWQQPHPIALADLIVRSYRAAGEHELAEAALHRYSGLVRDTADFMADAAEPQGDRFGLGPPLVPAQESYGSLRDRMRNPAFELTYWRAALLIACQWQEHLGASVPKAWRTVADRMQAPAVVDGVLPAVDVEPYTIRTDHPSMLASYGVVPPVGLVEAEVAAATLRNVLADWDWESTWGWDYPVIAMTAARLGDGEIAVDALLMPVAKNEHGLNGHNRQNDRLPAYLPGNGGLLAAVALMAAGWDGGPDCPGFPPHWQVVHEGLVPARGILR